MQVKEEPGLPPEPEAQSRSARSPAPSEATPLVGVSEEWHRARHGATRSIGIFCITDRVWATRLILLLLCIGMVGKEGSNGALSASMHELGELGFTSTIANLPGIGTIFYGTGKVAQLLFNYYLGARNTMLATGFLSSAGQLMFSTADRGLMTAGWALSQFANAQIWATSVRLIARWVDGPDVGRAIAAIGAATDVGLIMSNAMFAAFQAMFANDWMHAFAPFLCMGIWLGVQAVVEGLFLRDSAEAAGFKSPAPREMLERQRVAAERAEGKGGAEDGAEDAEADECEESGFVHPLDGLSITDALWSLSSDRRVWIAVATNTFYALHMGAMAFVPKFAIELLGYPDSTGTLLQMAGPIGSMTAAVGGGYAIDRLSSGNVKTLGYLLLLLGCASGGLFLGLLYSGSHQALATALPYLLMCTCLNTGFFWNVLLNVFAVRFGGATHASTLVFVLEISIYASGVPLSFLSGHLAASKHWRTLYTLSFVNFYLANLFAQLFVLFDEGASPMPRALRFWGNAPTPGPASDADGGEPEAKKDLNI